MRVTADNRKPEALKVRRTKSGVLRDIWLSAIVSLRLAQQNAAPQPLTRYEFCTRALRNAPFAQRLDRLGGINQRDDVKNLSDTNCIIITTWNTRDWKNCVENLSARQLKSFPGTLNDIDELPVSKRNRNDCLLNIK
ncbi:hypothetical protein ACOJD8_002371 [Cronobacter turicensis]